LSVEFVFVNQKFMNQTKEKALLVCSRVSNQRKKPNITMWVEGLGNYLRFVVMSNQKKTNTTNHVVGKD
jgi:hypothetical protein